MGVENQLHVKKPEIIQRYATYYAVIYIMILVCYSAVALIGMKNPVSPDEELIFPAVYPFELKSLVLKMIFTCHQVIIMCHAAIIPNLDGIVIMLIFTCTERLKFLEYYFKDVKTYDDLTRCIREHERVLQ